MKQKAQNKNWIAKFSHRFLKQFPAEQITLSEDQRKGRIFSYFISAVWILLFIDTCYQLYFAFAFQGQETQSHQKFSTYAISNISLLFFFGLIWWGHRHYPKLMRHIFLITIVLGAIFFFDIAVLNLIFVSLVLPIIMAAFLIQPIYSFFYYFLIASVYFLRAYLTDLTILDFEIAPINFIALSMIAIVAWLIAQSLDKALAEARALNTELDQRVQDRTRELAEALEREQTTAVRNKTIVESIADGVVVFDTDQHVLIANPAANKLARRNLEALNTTDLLNTIQQNEARESLQAWLKGQPPVDQTNIRFEWHDKTLSANVAPVILPRKGNKRVDAGNVMVLRDFTKEAQLEKAKDMFLGMVSHELRTPMSAIQGYVELLLDLEKETISEEGYEYLQTIDASIRQLLTLANELIDLSRLETGEVELYCQWVDVTDIVNDGVKMVQQEFMNRALSLETIIEAAAPLPKLYLDRRRILQVLLNLLSNAYKYTPQGGATVTVNRSDDWVTIAVADTGTGIKAEDQANMFQRFFRANDQVIQQADGTGLGLNISKGFTELHGGKLAFESQYGKGTTFTIYLPKNDTVPI